MEPAMTLDALFLAAHPDDVELFCGGTVARLSALGAKLALVDLTAGEKASNGTVEGRRAASLEAARLLGVESERKVLGLPDGGLDAGDSAHLGSVVQFLRENPCRLLFAPWPMDRHPDHVAAGELARKARLQLDTEDGTRPERVVHYAAHQEAPEHLFVDVTESMPAWRSAVACYADQFVASTGSKPTPINSPEFMPAQEARRRAWGEKAGCDFAEAFALDGILKIDDPIEFLMGSAE
jgi:bacillithiol biosynthesis deacetylase BshB1